MNRRDSLRWCAAPGCQGTLRLDDSCPACERADQVAHETEKARELARKRREGTKRHASSSWATFAGAKRLW